MTIAAVTPKASAPTPANLSELKDRAQALRLMGLLAHWDAVQSDAARLAWTGNLVGWEESERARRSLERRLRSARIGRFKPLADFDWDWPRQCDRATVQELMTLSFMADDFKLDDTLAYRAFLAFIPDGWISRVKAAPGTPGWSSFRGQISAASQAQAMTIIGAWFDWLVNAEYLRGNPWRLIKKAGQARAEDTRALDTKAITERAMDEIEAFIDRQEPSAARARARFIVSFLSSTGLRSAELLSAKVEDIRVEAEGVFLRVIGKRAKVRDVLLVDQAVQALDDYLRARGLGSVEHAPPGAPLLSSLEDCMAPVGYQTLYKTTRRWLERAVMFFDLAKSEKSRLAGASAHWLRHTFGTRAVALGAPFDVAQAQLGHANINTTMSLYSRAPLARRAAELRKAWAPNKIS